MKFKPEFVSKRLLYSQDHLIKEVYEQLQNGTIIHCEPLGTFWYDKATAIEFMTRLPDDSSELGCYWITNDQRRRLLKIIKTAMTYDK